LVIHQKAAGRNHSGIELFSSIASACHPLREGFPQERSVGIRGSSEIGGASRSAGVSVFSDRLPRQNQAFARIDGHFGLVVRICVLVGQ
jgi:hypothetical protein